VNEFWFDFSVIKLPLKTKLRKQTPLNKDNYSAIQMNSDLTVTSRGF